jgi:glutamate carboxypeptidase
MVPGAGKPAPPRRGPPNILHRVDVGAVRRLVATESARFVDALGELVSIDSGTYTPTGVNRVGDVLDRWFRDAGWDTERREHRPGVGQRQLGDVLVARVSGNGSHRVLLLCHMDTVWPEGTAAERPYRVEGARGFGPGVSDAKSGLLAGIEAVGALRRLGLDRFGTVTFLCNPDEEAGSPFSGASIAEHAKESDVVFVLEAGRENGDIVSARKGLTTIRAELTGRAAHAGVEPDRGRHAVLDGAMKTVELQAMNGQTSGLTVNVGVLSGGTRPNVVPDRCELHVDVRAWDDATLDDAIERVRGILERPAVDGVRAVVDVNIEYPPMGHSPATERLVDMARTIAGELGFRLDAASTGGGSDANKVAALGTAVLDGLGPIGGDDHSPDEWVDLRSVPDRVALLAGLIARSGDAVA